MLDDLERFWSRVDKSKDPDACWVWTGALNGNGYGQFYVARKQQIAHRWLLGQLRGEGLVWPEERGCHRCDNPPCCNPAHLYIGDAKANQADAMERSGYDWTRTHCPAGHEYTPENTYTHPDPRKGRSCRQCRHGQTVAARRAQGVQPRVFKTHCLRGHAMVDDNLYVHPKTGNRQCRTCKNLRHAKWAKAQRDKAREARTA